MHLLVTRPLNQANNTAEKLHQLGYECSVEPLLRVEETENILPTGLFDAIIITSANALPALDRNWPTEGRAEIPVVTTGEVTKIATRALGFENCQSVDGSALDLANQFSSLVPYAKNILYPCAEEVSLNLDQILDSPTRTCTSWVVYKINNVQKLTPAVSQALVNGKIDGILLYSSKTARIFSNLWENRFMKCPIPRIFSLSEKICAQLPTALSQRCSFPPNPNENDLFKLISKSTINKFK